MRTVLYFSFAQRNINKLACLLANDFLIVDTSYEEEHVSMDADGRMTFSRGSCDANKEPDSNNILFNNACCQTYLMIYDKSKRTKSVFLCTGGLDLGS
jgi:hypothetical protein